MADIDLERIVRLRARYGRPAARSTVAVRSIGARFKAASRGLAASTDAARRARTLDATDGESIRESFAGALRRSPRS
jgi:hypothetical protein